jgi:hypothetical protein
MGGQRMGGAGRAPAVQPAVLLGLHHPRRGDAHSTQGDAIAPCKVPSFDVLEWCVCSWARTASICGVLGVSDLPFTRFSAPLSVAEKMSVFFSLLICLLMDA